jgi:hypothetical protein
MILKFLYFRLTKVVEEEPDVKEGLLMKTNNEIESNNLENK